MDWLKDKKNQPIVAGVLAVVIVGAIVGVFFMMKGPAPPDAGATMDAQQPTTDPMAAPPGGAQPMPPTGAAPAGPAVPAAPAGAAPAAPGAAQAQAGASPMEAWRKDPFLPIGYRPPPKPTYVPKAPIPDLPFDNFSVLPTDEARLGPPDKVQPARRMAGLFLNDRIFAIVETNGKSEVVKPGDMLDDRLAVVDRIEKDRVVLKTTDPRPKYVVIRMASSLKTDANPNASPQDPSIMGGGPPMMRPAAAYTGAKFNGPPGARPGG